MVWSHYQETRNAGSDGDERNGGVLETGEDQVNVALGHLSSGEGGAWLNVRETRSCGN